MNYPSHPTAPDPDYANAQRPRVLVVDDDFLIRRINSEILLNAGYDVDMAEDGAAAWDALQLNSYDLLLTDNQMPKMTGLQLVGKVREANLPLPIIMATGTLLGPEVNQAHGHRRIITLLKPYTHVELLGTVAAVMSTKADGAEPVLVPNWESQPQVFGLRLDSSFPARH